MKKIRIISLCLAVLLLFGCLSACKEEIVESASGVISDGEESSETSFEVSDETSSEPEIIDGREPLEAALKAFDDVEDVKVEEELLLKWEYGTASFSELTQKTTEYLDYDSKKQSSIINATVKYGADYTVEYSETYIDGNTYLLYGEECFVSSEEEAPEIDLPDPSLYGSIVVSPESTEESTVIILSEPEGIEEWLAYSYADVVSAEVMVTLDGEGNITKYEYTAEYNQGAAIYEAEYSAAFTVYTDEDAPEITLPENIRDYSEVDSTVAVHAFDMAINYLKTLSVYEYSSFSFWMDEATGHIEEGNMTMNRFDYNDEFAVSKTISKYTGEYNFRKGEWEYDGFVNEITIRDGKKTSVINDDETESDFDEDDKDDFRKNSLSELTAFVPELSHIRGISYEAVDGYVTVTVTCNNKYLRDQYKFICDYLGVDTDLIESVSKEYSADQATYCITFDIDTQLPVATNVDISAVHEIDGYEFRIGVESNNSIVPENPECYYNITDEHYPEFDTEPADEDKAKPLFYKVTDGNGNVLWLLGTIHVGDNRTAYLPDEIIEAYNSSDAASFEIDIIGLEESFEEGDEKLYELYAEALYYDEDGKLEDDIDETLYRDTLELAQMLGIAAIGDYTSVTFDHYRANYWSSFINNLIYKHIIGVYDSKGVDKRLLELAYESDKKIYEFEDRYRQYTMDIDFSDAVHELNLYSAVYYPRSLLRAELYEMYDAWCAGDFDKLDEIINMEADYTGMSDKEIEAYEEYQKALKDDRDAEMLKTAIEYLESGETVFCAVGLAHLLDEDTGLVYTLEDAGYTVELVEYN